MTFHLRQNVHFQQPKPFDSIFPRRILLQCTSVGYKLFHWYHKSLDLFLHTNIFLGVHLIFMLSITTVTQTASMQGERESIRFTAMQMILNQKKNICLMYRMVIVKGFCLNDASTTRSKLSSIYYFLCIALKINPPIIN